MTIRACWQSLCALFTARENDVRGEREHLVADTMTHEQVDPFNPFPEPIQLEITDIFDLHTIAPREVRRAVEAYLLEAQRLGFRSVRLIHGKGRGVQRAAVRAILARTPFVLDWIDAPPQAGGLGATIAHLRPLADK